MGALWSALEPLPDHRTSKGRRYSLASIVGISLAAMLSGANDLLAIHRWGKRLRDWKRLELYGAIKLLKNLPMGAGDAAFTHRAIVDAIRGKGADYFLFVKGNHADLRRELAHAFGDDSPPQG